MAIELYIENIDVAEVRRKWIPADAQEVADCFNEDSTITEDDFSYAVRNVIDGRATYARDGLILIAKYGWSKAVSGDVDYEDSPIAQYEDDVADAARGLCWDKGIEIID